MGMNKEAFNSELMQFIAASPTPFHAVENLRHLLDTEGFTELPEAEQWQLQTGGKYYVTRNGSSLVAFRCGSGNPVVDGLRITGAHTDSPCLKVKPSPEIHKQHYFQLGVEVYGGALLNPWFDRDLSLAGRVTFQTHAGSIRQALIDFEQPIAVIPSLAIHLDRSANESRSVNPQTDIPPIVSMYDKETIDFRALLLGTLLKRYPDAAKVFDYELSFYDVQPPSLVGLHQEFIASARLDNLLSCFTGLRALLDADTGQSCVVVCNDHEEVGSQSAVGAQGPMLKSVLERWIGTGSDLTRALAGSMLVSADNAHGVHPNFSDKHDSNHGPLLNQGPVIKLNANQRYATNSETSALFRHFAEQADVPLQSFVVRTDMACGSTIGPLTASELGVKTLDVGVPTFAMHSIRELAGSDDAHNLYRILLAFKQCADLSVK